MVVPTNKMTSICVTCEKLKYWCDECYKNNHNSLKADRDKLYKMKVDKATTREEWDKMTTYMTEKYAEWGYVAPTKRWVDKRFPHQ